MSLSLKIITGLLVSRNCVRNASNYVTVGTKVYKGKIDQFARKARMIEKFLKAEKSSKKNHSVVAQNAPLLLTRARGDDRSFTRRQLMLNKNFMTCISDALMTEPINMIIGKYGVRLTQVQVCKHYDYVNVYWSCDDHDINEVGQALSHITGNLHKFVSDQNFIGKIPMIKFNYDLTSSRSAHIRKLIESADYAKDFVPTDPTIFSPPTKVASDEEKSIEDLKTVKYGFTLYKKSLALFDEYRADAGSAKADNQNRTPVFEHPEDMNLSVLGLDYKSIMNKVLFHMKKARAEHRGYNSVADPLPPAEWIAPAPFPATDQETQDSNTADERIKIMNNFMIENRKKRQRMSRDARRASDERLQEIGEHIDSAQERVLSGYDAQDTHY